MDTLERSEVRGTTILSQLQTYVVIVLFFVATIMIVCFRIIIVKTGQHKKELATDTDQSKRYFQNGSIRIESIENYYPYLYTTSLRQTNRTIVAYDHTNPNVFVKGQGPDENGKWSMISWYDTRVPHAINGDSWSFNGTRWRRMGSTKDGVSAEELEVIKIAERVLNTAVRTVRAGTGDDNKSGQNTRNEGP